MGLNDRRVHVHFVGVGGVGMSGLAELLLVLGHRVSGSDQKESLVVESLREKGVQIQIGHSDEIFKKAVPDVLVYSSAVARDNPEIAFCQKHKVPIVQRAEMLAEIMRLKRGIAIAGSHGKTTTTGILGLLLKEASMSPTLVIGGRFDAIASNAVWGDGAWMVAEADESDGSFMLLHPEIAVLTNIDREHMENYPSYEDYKNTFLKFANRVPFYGMTVLCSDCDELYSLKEKFSKRCVWYGKRKERQPDFLVEMIDMGATGVFEVSDERFGRHRFELGVPGEHNALNATAAYIVAREFGVDSDSLESGFKKFKGVERRFEYCGKWRGHTVIDDYAHHPTEIRATIQAALQAFKEKPIILCQPHRYSRVKDLWKEFQSAFMGAEMVFTLPIYPASEKKESWCGAIDEENFAKNIQGVSAIFCQDFNKVLNRLSKTQLPKAAPILVLGAGNSRELTQILVQEHGK